MPRASFVLTILLVSGFCFRLWLPILQRYQSALLRTFVSGFAHPLSVSVNFVYDLFGSSFYCMWFLIRPGLSCLVLLCLVSRYLPLVLSHSVFAGLIGHEFGLLW